MASCNQPVQVTKENINEAGRKEFSLSVIIQGHEKFDANAPNYTVRGNTQHMLVGDVIHSATGLHVCKELLSCIKDVNRPQNASEVRMRHFLKKTLLEFACPFQLQTEYCSILSIPTILLYF